MKKVWILVLLCAGCHQTVSCYIEQEAKTEYGVTKAKLEYKLIEVQDTKKAPIAPGLAIKQTTTISKDGPVQMFDVEIVK